MSDPENFLARWSRRKREAVEEGEQAKSPPSSAPAQGVNAEVGARADENERKPAIAGSGASGASEPAEPAFDITRLPPLESITAESDIRPFLAPGVPADLTRAALRRAWAADPKIRDFVGLAEYAWDYHAPGSMAGFGPLEMTDDLRRLVARMVGGGAGEGEAEQPSPAATAACEPQTSIESSTDGRISGRVAGDEQAHPATSEDERTVQEPETSSRKEDVALQHEVQKSDDLRTIIKRPHGRALPK
jgi:hypothetical protein